MAFIDPKKLLNSSSGNGGSALVAQPKMFLVPVKNTEYKQTVDLSEQIQENDLSDPEQQVLEDIKVIREKVVKIEDILKKTIKINIKKIQLRRKEDENKKRKAQEDKLEKKDKKRIGMPKIPIPGMSFIDRIKQFLGTVFTGFLVMQIFKLLPKLMAFLDYVKPVTAFIEDFVKGMFDKFVFAIDFGYKIVDGAQSKVKELFGDDGEKKFSEFTSTFTKFMNLAIIAGMATMGGQDPLRDRRFQGPQRRGFDRSGRRVSNRAQQRYQRRFGDQRYKERFGDKNLKRLKGKTPRPAQGLDQRLVQRGVGKIAGKKVGRIAGKLPIVGPLIDFGIRRFVFDEPLGKAAAGAVGAAVGQSLGAWVGGAIGGVAGSVVPIVGNLLAGAAGATIGGLIGGLIGDQIGVSLYNVMMSSKPKKVQARAEGGKITQRTGRDPARNVRRKKPKPLRIQKLKINKVNVGQSIGSKSIKDLYGTSDTSKQPLSTLISTSDKLKRSGSSLMGKIMSLGVDYVLGQKPSKTTRRDIAKSFAALMSMISEYPDAAGADITKSFQALAGGGEVLRRDVKIRRKNEQLAGFMRGIEKALDKDIGSLGSLAAIIRNNGRSPDPYGGGDTPEARLRGGSNSQIEADLLEYFTAIYGKNAAIGIVGNMMRESGYRTRTPDNATFEGIVQWDRKDRWPRFVKWAESKGLDPYSRNAQVQYVAVELKQYGLDDDLRNAKSPEEAAQIFYEKFERGADTGRYSGSDSEKKHLRFMEGIKKRNPNIGRRTGEVAIYPRTGGTGYRPPTPGLFNAIEYITGDSTQGSNYDPGGHGGDRYHEHIAFRTEADKERAKAALRAAGFEIGSELRPGDRGYHGSNLAIDVPLYKPSGGGVQKGYSDNASGEKKFSAEVRKVLGIGTTAQPNSSLAKVIRSTKIRGNVFTEREGGKYFKNNKPVTKDVYDAGVNNNQASISPSRSRSIDIASLSQRTSYDDGVDRVLIVNVVDKIG